MKIVVLGGGITGLVTTHLLVEEGHDVTCLEAADRCGGLCRSEVVDGFVADRAGGHIMFSKDGEVLEFVKRLVDHVGHHTTNRKTFINLKRRYVQYPFENGLADLEPGDTFACLRDYIEMQFARRQGAAEPDDFHSWCLWRFGKGICDLFMHPYNEKIWNVPLDELGVEWVSGRVPDAPMEDILRSALGIRTEGYAHQAIFHYPNEGGFEAMIHGVLRRIPEGVVRTGTPCETLSRDGDGWEVNGEPYDRVVSTIPLQELFKVLPGVPEGVSESFRSLDYTSLMTVFLALDKADAPDHSWVYFPDPADGPQNRITWLSNYAPGNAPEGCSSVMAEVTYYRTPPGSDADVTTQVIEGLSGAGVIDADQVRWSRVWHNEYAYILYRKGLEENLEVVRGYCDDVDIDVIGRFGNYSYFNSDMCIRAAMDLVKESYSARR